MNIVAPFWGVTYGCVSYTTNKTMRLWDTTKLMKPSSRSLLRTINGLFEFVDMTRMIMMNKPRRLLHVNFLRKISIKKGVFNIQVVK